MAFGKKRDEVNQEIEKDLKEQTGAAETEETDRVETQSGESSPEETQTPSEDQKNVTGETEEIKKKNEEIETLNNRLLRLQADFLNFKARTEKDKLTSYGDAEAGLICDLLPVIDNLERAIAADKTETDNFKEGVVMVYNQLMGILDKKGLKEVEALHKPFDHNLHYGVAFEECEDYDDGIIIDVLQKGYTVKDKLIRPAMVRICKKP